MHVKKIIVSMHLEGRELELGELVSEGKRIYFKYYISFIEIGMEISPFKLKLSDKLYTAEESPFRWFVRSICSKNFSFLMDNSGNWKLAPAYDLTFSNSSHGMHSTMVSNESRNPGKTHLMKVANYFKINNAKEIIQKAEDVVSNWKSYAVESGVEKETRNMIKKKLEKSINI